MTTGNPYRRLTPEEQRGAIREVVRIQEEGLLNPMVVFNPSGFDFHIEYYADAGGTIPIPEFRVYAQQYLTLLAVILSSYRDFLPAADVCLRASVEVIGDALVLVLCADLSLFGVGEMHPLHVVGTSFNSALQHIFPSLKESIFWDWQPNTDYGKFWLKYPGAMTVDGFTRTAKQPHLRLGWKAKLEIPHPTDEQHTRAIALRDFIYCEPSTEL
jgi:hypothetical protein